MCLSLVREGGQQEGYNWIVLLAVEKLELVMEGLR